jgi:hypothetical protein
MKITQEELEDWLASPITQFVIKASMNQDGIRKHQILEHFWETGETSPELERVRGRLEVMSFLEQQRKAVAQNDEDEKPSAKVYNAYYKIDARNPETWAAIDEIGED